MSRCNSRKVTKVVSDISESDLIIRFFKKLPEIDSKYKTVVFHAEVCWPSKAVSWEGYTN